jgi:predicted MPP superfamily phosphohydrolase
MPLSRRSVLAAVAGVAVTPVVARAERRRIASEYFEITRVEVTLPSVDEVHDGLVIAQLSDIHIGGGVPDGRVISAVRAINEEAPDVVMLTGDFITTRRDPVERVPQLLGSLKAPTFAVLGNHDHWTFPDDIAKGLEREGISVLRNRNTTVKLKDGAFTVIGIDDSTSGKADVDEAFQGAASGTRLVLTHTPACATHLPAWQDLLCLSGHTHGGQWDVPRLTEGFFRRVGQPYYRGSYAVRGNQLYVNRGLGFGSGTRLPRINSDPELTLFTLRRARAA